MIKGIKDDGDPAVADNVNIKFARGGIDRVIEDEEEEE